MLKHIRHKILLQCCIYLFLSAKLFSQQAEVAFFGGVSNYLGDLQQTVFSGADAGGVLGIIYKYPVSSRWFIRAGLSQGKLSAWDGNNEKDLQIRNLSFETNITDGYLGAEFRLFSEDMHAIIPYAFTGFGFFHYNPYTIYGDKNEKVYLQPLGTEGQGLPEYPEKKLYNLTQVMIPLGGGVLWHVNDKWTVGIEMRQNFTFTDYLDDVSTNYALPGPLLRDRGQLALDVAWRRDEIDGRPYPVNQSTRGNPDNKDWYYYAGVHLAMKIQAGRYGKGTPSGKAKNQMGCPKW